MTSDDSFYYEGFSSPNGTIVPDDVFDVLAPRLKESELRVLLYIVRRTFGFGKNADAISLRQMTDGITRRDGKVIDHGTGMSKRAVIQGTKGLAEKGIIEVIRRKKTKGHNAVNIYRLRFKDDQRVVTEGNPPGTLQSPPAVTSGHPQETVKQDSESHNTTVVGENQSQPTNKPLYYELKAMGIEDEAATQLVTDHDARRIRDVIDYVNYRMERGWTPHTSPAAWVVAAIRDDYELSTNATSAMSSSITPAEAAQLAETQEKRLNEEFSEARREELQKRNIPFELDEIWLEIQDRMRSEGQWTPALAATLLEIEGETAILHVPRLLEEAIQIAGNEIFGALTGDDRLRDRVEELEIRPQGLEMAGE